MATGLCPLCITPGELRESHIIPNAYFRAMKRQRAGRLISFNSLPHTSVRLSNESWSEEMLCGNCEGNLSKLETKCIFSLRRTAREIENKSEYGALLHSFDFNLLSRFLLSVLWRAAISKQEPFAQILLAPEVAEEIRLSLLNPPAPVTKLVHCQISKLRDGSGRIPATRFEGVASSPVAAVHGQAVSFTFIFAGYVVRFFIPYIPTKFRGQLGWVKPGRQFFVPTVAMTRVPELMQLMVAGHAKARAGKVAF